MTTDGQTGGGVLIGTPHGGGRFLKRLNSRTVDVKSAYLYLST